MIVELGVIIMNVELECWEILKMVKRRHETLFGDELLYGPQQNTSGGIVSHTCRFENGALNVWLERRMTFHMLLMRRFRSDSQYLKSMSTTASRRTQLVAIMWSSWWREIVSPR